MAVINFPSSPTNGQTLTSGLTTYSYNSAYGTWDLVPAVAVGPQGSSGVTSVNAPIVNSGTSTSANLSLDSSVTINTSAQTLTNKTLTSPIINGATLESAYTTSTGFAGYTFDVTTNGSVQYITANSTASGTLNFRSTSSVSLNTLMSVNQSISVILMVTNGATAYYPNAFQIDGTSVTLKWQGGTAITSGNASSIDAYSFSIIKTAANTFTVLAGRTKFA